jgi:hypothetical protein
MFNIRGDDYIDIIDRKIIFEFYSEKAIVEIKNEYLAFKTY